MASDLRPHAERIAGGVSADAVGLDPATIIAILTTVLPLIIGCFKRNDEPDPQEVAQAVRDAYARNPRRLLARTTRSVRAESPKRLTKDQAEELAEAIIEDCLAQDDATVAECCQ